MLSAFLWRSQPLDMVLSWQILMLVLAAFLAALAWGRRRAVDAQQNVKTWVRYLAIGAAALGAGWGYAAAVFFPGGVDHQVFLSFIVALVSAGALPIFSTLWWVYAIFAAAVMLPFNVVLFSHGTEFLRLLGAAVPLLYVANVITAYELGRAFLAAYSLRTAYRRLSADNAEIQAQLGEQLDSLLDAHREVQAAGRKLQLFSERAPIAVFELDPNATILDMNPAAENLFGYAAPELVGRNWITMVLVPEERERDGSMVARLHRRRQAGDHRRRALPAPRRPRARLRMDAHAALRRGAPRQFHRPAGPRHHAAARRRAREERVHLDAEPRAAHAAHLDPRLAAAPDAAARSATWTRTRPSWSRSPKGTASACSTSSTRCSTSRRSSRAGLRWCPSPWRSTSCSTSRCA